MRYLCVLIALILCVGGCIPDSENPLTDPEGEAIDSALLGTWFWNEESDSGYVHMGLDKTSTQLIVLMVEYSRDGSIDISELHGHTSLLDDKRYLNLKWVRPEDEVKGYIFVKYATQGESLAVSLMDRETVEQAIKNKVLKGEVTEGEFVSSVHITEEQEKLQKFVVKNDQALFPEKALLSKLTLPRTTPAPKEIDENQTIKEDER